MFCDEINRRIAIFLKKKGFRFEQNTVVRYSENDSSVVVRLFAGESNFYVKAFLGRSKETVLQEIRFINKISECGIGVPKIIHIDGECVFACEWKSCCIIFYIMSELIGDAIVVKETYFDIASKIADIHNMKEKFQCFEQGERKSDHYRLEALLTENRKFASEFLNVEQVKHMLKNHIPPNDYCLIHSDLYMGNIVTMNGYFVGLIDFSDVRNGLPEDDFAKFLQNMLTSHVDFCLAKEIVKMYGKKRNHQIDFKEIYLSCIYRILFNYRTIVKQPEKEISEKYKKAINFCIMEYKKYE